MEVIPTIPTILICIGGLAFMVAGLSFKMLGQDLEGEHADDLGNVGMVSIGVLFVCMIGLGLCHS